MKTSGGGSVDLPPIGGSKSPNRMIQMGKAHHGAINSTNNHSTLQNYTMNNYSNFSNPLDNASSQKRSMSIDSKANFAHKNMMVQNAQLFDIQAGHN